MEVTKMKGDPFHQAEYMQNPLNFSPTKVLTIVVP